MLLESSKPVGKREDPTDTDTAVGTESNWVENFLHGHKGGLLETWQKTQNSIEHSEKLWLSKIKLR